MTQERESQTEVNTLLENRAIGALSLLKAIATRDTTAPDARMEPVVDPNFPLPETEEGKKTIVEGIEQFVAEAVTEPRRSHLGRRQGLDIERWKNALLASFGVTDGQITSSRQLAARYNVRYTTILQQNVTTLRECQQYAHAWQEGNTRFNSMLQTINPALPTIPYMPKRLT